jgi:hypothetical protein
MDTRPKLDEEGESYSGRNGSPVLIGLEGDSLGGIWNLNVWLRERWQGAKVVKFHEYTSWPLERDVPPGREHEARRRRLVVAAHTARVDIGMERMKTALNVS